MCGDTPAHQVMGAVMAMNIFPHTCDTGGKLQSSVTPSSGDDLVNKTYADAGGGGGGSSKQSFSVRLAGRFSVSSTSTTRMFTHSSGMGNAMGGDFSLTRTEAGTSDTSFTTTAIQGAYYYTIGVAPFACTLESSSMWAQFRYTYSNGPAYRVWKGTYTDGSGGDITWTEVVSAQSFPNASTTNASNFITTSLSSGNSFNAGDLIGLTFQTSGSANTNLNQFTSTIMFLES